MTAGTARTAPRPRTWAISSWAGTARPAAAWSRHHVVADERVYYPVHAVPYTPAGTSPGQERSGIPHQAGRRRGAGHPGRDGGVRVPGCGRGQRLRGPGRVPRRAGRGRAAVRDGPQAAPRDLGLGPDAHTPVDAARALAWGGRRILATGRRVARTFRDGHAETWWAADARWAGGAGRAPGAWWWPPPTPAPCPPRPPGTWSPACPGPAARASRTALIRRQAWPRSCGSTASATGSSRATGRSRTSWAGPTSRSAPTRDPPPPGPGQLRVLLLLGRLVRPS